MDKSVKRIRPKDYELSTVQDNLANPLQQVLEFINGNKNSAQIELSPLLQRLRGPGTPQSIQTPALLVHGDSSNSGGNTVVLGDAPTANAAQIGCNVGLYGNLNLYGASVLTGALTVVGSTVFRGNVSIVAGLNAFSVMSQDSSNPASVVMFMQNYQGNANWALCQDGSVTAQGTQTATSFVSGVGFKSMLPMGGFWNTNYPGGILFTQQVIRQTGNLGAASTIAQKETMASAGSVTAITVSLDTAVNATMQAGVYKNGAQIYYGTIAAANVTKGVIKISKGAVPFAQGDVLTCAFGFSASGVNTAAQLNFEIELGA